MFNFNVNPETVANNTTAIQNNTSEINTLKALPHITEKYVNGASWYKIYSDGWVEQGGFVSRNSDNSTYVPFLIPYNNTNYSVFVDVADTRDVSGYCSAANRNGVQFRPVVTGGDKDRCWYACGYPS